MKLVVDLEVIQGALCNRKGKDATWSAKKGSDYVDSEYRTEVKVDKRNQKLLKLVSMTKV